MVRYGHILVDPSQIALLQLPEDTHGGNLRTTIVLVNGEKMTISQESASALLVNLASDSHHPPHAGARRRA
jgi:hypothetical protein